MDVILDPKMVRILPFCRMFLAILEHFGGRAQCIAGRRTACVKQHLQNRLDHLLARCADAQGRFDMGAP